MHDPVPLVAHLGVAGPTHDVGLRVTRFRVRRVLDPTPRDPRGPCAGIIE
jgi:hypothetical protein